MKEMTGKPFGLGALSNPIEKRDALISSCEVIIVSWLFSSSLVISLIESGGIRMVLVVMESMSSKNSTREEAILAPSFTQFPLSFFNHVILFLWRRHTVVV